MSNVTLTSCNSDEEAQCRNIELAFHLKLGAIVAILFAGAIGVALPLVGKKLSAFRTDGPYFAVAKAFAAGVILATALGTLMIDVIGTEYYERKHAKETAAHETASHEWVDVPSLNEAHSDGHIDAEHIHVVGMRAHAVSHTHSHSNGGSCSSIETLHKHEAHTHVHSNPISDDTTAHIRHMVVSQVLELGVVTHSNIIGVSLGVSQSPCTIRPLSAALAFHQFFEGFALGGCKSQAGFKSFSTIAMTMCFTIASGYNSNSPGALIVEGIFDSISAGILIYMALVDLIAADFLSKRMCCNRVLQVLSYVSLFFGAAAMSALAVWA
ncbi:hypothetical protein KP509_02G073300 [Ceratopteris richardii]|uniref:Uncharacterized protein n=1 Tax=Ceratopteris richardii TaxID=49495 RepID=A0A8T2VAS6_CERRI|nr:hypothetical protein KP509_02G073300 [Ceratopteris richardii]